MSCESESGSGCASAGACGGVASRGNEVDDARRNFLRGAAATTVATLATGVTLFSFGAEPAVGDAPSRLHSAGEAEAQELAGARAAGEKVTSKVRWGLLIDASKCADDCTACVTACQTENGWHSTGHPETDPQWIRKLTVTNPKNGASFSLPMLCQHCAEAPCVYVCPTGASFKRADGIVLVDRHICIGCRYCMMACPYKGRSFVHEPLHGQKPYAPRGKGTVEGCTLCVHRIDTGRIPACVEACNDSGGGAMLFGDLNDPSSEIAKRVTMYRATHIRADLGTDTGVLYRNI